MSAYRRLADAARWPALARLQARLAAERRKRLAAACGRGAVSALSLQALLLPVLAWCSMAHPYEVFWIRALQWSYVIYLWVPAAGLVAWLRGALNRDRVAADLDRAQAGPDCFRTLLSLENHRPETLDALDAYYTSFAGAASVGIASPFASMPWRRLALCLAVGALLPLGSGHYAATATRMLFPAKAWSRRSIPQLDPMGLPRRVALGDTLRLRVRTAHLAAAEPVYALIRDARGEIRYPMERAGDSARLAQGPVQSDLAIRFQTVGAETPEWNVRVVTPPHPDSFGATIRPPAYTRLPDETLPQFPATQAMLPGSLVMWGLRASEPLVKLIAVLQTEGAVPETLHLGSGSAFRFAREIRRPTALRLELLSVQDGDSIIGHAGPYRLETAGDAPPEIALVAPDSDQALGRALKLPILFRARDDFGLTRVRLCYAVFSDGLKSQGVKDITTWLQSASGLGGGVWDLGGLELAPGNVVELHLEAVDNDTVPGPHTSRSQTVRLRLPSLEEVLTQEVSGEKGAATSLRSASERAAEMRREWDESGKPAEAPSPPPLGPWDVERILSLEPQQSLQQVQSHLQAEAARAGSDAPLGKQLRDLQRTTSEMQRQLPAPGVSRESLPDQERQLDTLLRNQQTLTRDFSALKPLPSGVKAADPLAVQRQQIQQQLQHELQDQKDLRDWMQDQKRVAAESDQRRQQAEQDQARMREDVRQAMDQMQKTMEQAAANGVLSPDLMEKMQRIRELLQATLPDSLIRAQESAANQVGLDEVKKNLDDMLNHGDALSASLDRALHMLEMLQGVRDLQNYSQTLRGLEADQKKLQAKMNPGGNPASTRAAQAALRRKLEEALRSVDSLAAKQSAFHGLQNSHGRAAAGQMRAAENQLQQGNENAASQSAGQAAQSLDQAAQAMDAFAQRFQGGPDAAEIAAALDETLAFSDWIALLRDPRRRTLAGWSEGDSALDLRVAETAEWLRGKLEKLAARQPYAAEEMTLQASALGYHGQALAQDYSEDEADSLLLHARLAARELLKWLDRAEHPSPSMGGGGAGLPQAGGSQSGGAGMDALAGRLQGISGRQMAVNDATQELLQAFMQGRKPGAGAEGEGSSDQPNGENSGGENPGGESANGERGNDGSGKTSGSQSSSQAAAGQQAIGESLESMAESESDAGGAARKLRELAQEARNLENDLRSGRMNAEEIRQQQDRFHTRLLEAANAMEVRGQDRKRQAEAYQGQTLTALPADTASRRDWFRELQRRRAEARDLALSPEQRSYLEWYYDHLLTQ